MTRFDDDDDDGSIEPVRLGEFGFRTADDPFDPDEGDEGDSTPSPDDGGDDVTNAVAMLEWSLQSSEADERSCIWCRELIVDDFDHDFCEPDEPTEKMPRLPESLHREPTLDMLPPDFDPRSVVVYGPGGSSSPSPPWTQPSDIPDEPEPLVWRDHLVCPDCQRWMPVELVAPPNAVDRHLLTATTITCCSVAATVTYSWSRGTVVALRYQKKAAQPN